MRIINVFICEKCPYCTYCINSEKSYCFHPSVDYWGCFTKEIKPKQMLGIPKFCPLEKR